ncbi:unnamed protein product [Clonostachys rhizophaga]|uniref:Uncharacterized protein n=1 Tax=Clonostachys rhizophaga TaxID=160324 RepID=A0A9N9V620_9HYPO|nr:unnamed protein product [Clonostachys rhizophaga]
MSHRRLNYNLEGVKLGQKSWMNNLPPPPPLPPTPPPPKEEESEPVYEFIVKDEAECLKAQEEEARKSFYGEHISHLKYSEIDWTIPIKEFDAGKCIVKGIDCQPVPNSARILGILRKHFHSKKHLDWEEKMRKKAEDEAKMAPTPPDLPTPTSTKRKFGDAFLALDNGE